MSRAVLGNVAFPVGAVMADAAEVAERLPRGDGPFFLGKFRTVSLRRCVKVWVAAVPRLQDRGFGNRFGNRTQAEERGRRCRRVVLQSGDAKPLAPARFANEDAGGRK